LFAISSVLWLAALLAGEQRPRYGGILRVTMRETPQAIAPRALVSSGVGNVSRLIFETLIHLDADGRPQAMLASSWQAEPGNQRWRISLRDGVSFHDGFPMDAASVVASLRAGNPQWKVFAVGEAVIIEAPAPEPMLPAELALAGNAIVHQTGDKIAGTGPFVPRTWVTGKSVELAANDEYWRGRPFVDAIQISFGVGEREQMLALDLAKADIVEVQPEGIRRARAEGRTVFSSQPAELLTLVFARDAQNEDEIHARNALAASLDSASLSDYVLQGGGEASGALLPDWVSGYGFVFPPSRKSERPVRAQPHISWTLSYDAADSVAHVLADRIALNARDAGIAIQPTASGTGDLKLLRAPILSSDPQLALTEMADALQLSPPKMSGTSIEELFAGEKSLLQSGRVVPLAHLRTAVAVRANVQAFNMQPGGEWDMSNLWLAPEKP
jgi:MarR-like DNA-binding transcriptional regulator SgrR of sgrS sRNA